MIKTDFWSVILWEVVYTNPSDDELVIHHELWLLLSWCISHWVTVS
jgi:hypothetical protein